MTEDAEDGIALDAEIMARLTALAAFATAMGEADKVFEAASAPREQRRAVIAALAAVHRLLADTGMLTYAGPVVDCALALDALDETGVISPLLQTPRPGDDEKRGRKSVPTGDWVQRAVVAAALEQRFSNSKTGDLRDAAAQVARWLSGSIVLRTSNKPGKAIVDWRQSMLARSEDEEPKRVYSAYVRLVAGVAGQYEVDLNNKEALFRALKILGASRKH